MNSRHNTVHCVMNSRHNTVLWAFKTLGTTCPAVPHHDAEDTAMRISNLGHHLCLLKFCNILCLCICACRTNIMKYEVASWSYPSKYVCLVGRAVSAHYLFISWLPVHSLPVKHDWLSAVCCQAVLLCLAYVAISKAWDIKWLLKDCWICGLISHVAESFQVIGVTMLCL